MSNFARKAKKEYRGIIDAMIVQAIRVTKWPWVNSVAYNSCPPLKPMENNRYMEKNFDNGSGIESGDRTATASIPRKKNKTGGFRKFSKMAFESIVYS
jgi:hypothetical protein